MYGLRELEDPELGGPLAPFSGIHSWKQVMQTQKPLEYIVTGRRVDAHGSVAQCKAAEIILDTDLAGRADAFNPAELLLAALSACMIKGIERVAPMIHFQYRGVEVRIHGIPPGCATQDVAHRL